MINKWFWSLICVLSITVVYAQGGGMWIPTELNEEEMRSMGMRIGAKDIFNPNKASIKDAVAHFGGGCTSEVISPQGLLLTNHHCGYSQIQSHSSVENDYLTDGFWAKNMGEELPNPGLTATFIVDIQDVTDQVLQGMQFQMEESARLDLVKRRSDAIVESAKKSADQDAFVRAFYKGNKYYLFITETYRDVRLVGAPPNSIGKYGSDTDNWVWPRHTGDFALFRIYADKNNRPAEYHKDNVPFKPKHHLPVSIKGVKEGDFTFVFGFPGVTDEYLPGSALEMITKTQNPARIALREEALKIMDGYMRADDKIRIQYASKYARIANFWKKWIGESQGIARSGAIDIKKNYEAQLQEKIRQHCLTAKNEKCAVYPSVIPQLNELYEQITPYNLAADYFDEALYRNSETFRVALLLNNLVRRQGDRNYDDYYTRVSESLASLYRDYNANVDTEVSMKLWEMYQKNMPAAFRPLNVEITQQDIQNSIITGGQKINGKDLTQHTSEIFANRSALLQAATADPLVQKMGEVLAAYEKTVVDNRSNLQNQINQLMRIYMQAQLDFKDENQKIFPDANSTLRVTYGQVKGYSPSDAVYYDHTTYMEGVLEKYVPGDYEFDLPKKLIDLQEKKDYGRYATDGKQAVNFIATNHTTGGNSGSPALDADGNLIGLNFDRVWEGTMSDLYYDPNISRNIMVDSRFILFVIDKFADSKWLINEMTIVE
ncbi:MAG: S46 family peptidase [Weeksellaceae bacterium]|nr:S46 family peptidase [Weeksellaceae bacterium]